MSYQVNTPWLKVTHVVPLENYRLQVVLENNKQVFLDLTTLIEKREHYWRLKNPRYFCQVGIDVMGGICWPEGEDLAPDGLERYFTKKESILS